jgi:hypothetical protein
LAHFTAKPLWAQVKAALIQNVDEPARNPFSEDFAIGATAPGCAPTYCDLSGNLVVPAGKRLVITNVTGWALTANGVGAFVTLKNVDPATGGGGGAIFLPSTVTYYGGSSYIINLNLQLQSYYEAGQRIGFYISTNGTFSYQGSSVRVSGYYVNL